MTDVSVLQAGMKIEAGGSKDVGRFQVTKGEPNDASLIEKSLARDMLHNAVKWAQKSRHI